MAKRPVQHSLILTTITLLIAQAMATGQGSGTAAPPDFMISVELDQGFSREPVSGRLFLLVTPNLIGEPRYVQQNGGVGFVFAQEVKHWQPGTLISFAASHVGFPTRLGAIPPGRYNLQAILDRHPTDRDVTFAAGNGRSRAKREDINPALGGSIQFKLNREITRNKLQDISRIEYRRPEIRSVGRETQTRTWVTCAVVLPTNYKHDKDKTYPIQYWIPDFGTPARGALNFFQSRSIFNPSSDIASRTEKFIHVLIDPHCKNGHHFWINSKANGPYQTALMEEVIPAIESEYRVRRGTGSRFLVGIGAGGYAAINLVIDRPNFFSGAWALSPDAISFEDFLGMDFWVKHQLNAFLNDSKQPRPMLEDPETGRTILTVRAQSELETVLGPGSKLSGYESAFSPASEFGKPAPLFNRRTGSSMNPPGGTGENSI